MISLTNFRISNRKRNILEIKTALARLVLPGQARFLYKILVFTICITISIIFLQKTYIVYNLHTVKNKLHFLLIFSQIKLS